MPRYIKSKAERKEGIFRKDVFDVRLKTHKLKGRLEKYWAFSIDFQYRIVFTFDEGNIITFHAIGTHAVYKLFFS